MNKRALMLTAAATALLSGQAYATNPNPPCSTTTSTTSPQLCDITTAFSYPIFTGAAPSYTVTSAVAGVGNVTVDTDGSLTVSTSPPTAPAVTLNSGTSSAPTLVTNVTQINYENVSYATGVLLEEASVTASASTAENWVGEYYSSSGTLDLLGSGTNKVGILIAGAAYNGTSGTTDAATGVYANQNLGVFTGMLGTAGGFPTGGTSVVAIDIASGSILEVQGTSSNGIELIGPTYSQVGTSSTYTPSGGGTLIGDIDVGGSVLMTPTTVGSTTTTENVAIDILGWLPSSTQTTNPALASTAYANTAYAMIGNINVLAGGTVSSEGAGAQGIMLQGELDGAIVNQGTVESFGTTTPSTALNANDPEGGSALLVANTVTGGIFNGGPTGPGSTTSRATISMIGDIFTLYISPAINTNVYSPITIGPYTDGANYTFSLLNRGNITASSEDANISNGAIAIVGQSSSATVTLPSGIFNSGTIVSTATTNADGPTTSTSVTATGLQIGNFVTIGTAGTVGTGTLPGGPYALVNYSIGSGTGVISASVSGAQTGTATAILVQSAGAGVTPASLPSIFNSGTIAASATTTNLTSTGLSAFAIIDESGTLQTIYNEGTISATATTLDDNDQIADAIDTTSNLTTPVTITDQSTASNGADIIGDVHFGALPGTLTVSGNAAYPAVVEGNIYFGNICTASSTTGVCAGAGVPTDKNDQLTIGSYGTVIGQIIEAGKVGSVDITIQSNGTLNLLTTAPTNINSTVSQQVVAGTPLSVGTLTVETGGVLRQSLSQGFNVAVYPDSSVINAQSATIQAPANTTLAPLQVTFGSYIAAPSTSNQTATFVLIATPNGNLAVNNGALTLLESSQSNAIPFLYTGNVCTYNVAGSILPCPPGTEPINSTDSEIVLNLTPKTAQELGLTGYAKTMFPYANQALVNDPSLGAAMVAGITSNATAQAAYAAFAPDVSGATRATAISLTDSASNIVAARQRELRMFANVEGDTTLWGQQFGQRLSQNNTPTLTGYNDSGYGFTMGGDEGDPADGRYGIAFTFFTGGMSQKEPTTAKTQSEYYLLTGYTDWRGKGLFLDTQLGAGYGNLKGRRYLELADDGTVLINREAQNQRATELLAGSVTTGSVFTAGSTIFTPQVDLDGMTMREEGYTETGGGEGFDLRVRPYYADSLRAFAGMDLREDFNFGDFFLQPELRAGYRYDFVDGAVKLRANFASVGPANGQLYTPFTVEGPDPGRGNVVLGSGVAATTGAWSIGINYDFIHGNNGPTAQTGILTLVGRI